MTDEPKLWQAARARLPGYWIRLEDALNPGTPDVVGTLAGHTVFLELKRQTKWRAPHDLELGAYQIAWHQTWNKRGGTSYILAQVADDIFLLNPLEMNRLYKGSRDYFRDLSPAWGWDAVIQYVRHPLAI